MDQLEFLLVNISSVLGLIGYVGQGFYVIVKFVVWGFMEILCQELAGIGVYVVVVYLGLICINFIKNICYQDQDLLQCLVDVFEKVVDMSVEEVVDIIFNGICKGCY